MNDVDKRDHHGSGRESEETSSSRKRAMQGSLLQHELDGAKDMDRQDGGARQKSGRWVDEGGDGSGCTKACSPSCFPGASPCGVRTLTCLLFLSLLPPCDEKKETEGSWVE